MKHISLPFTIFYLLHISCAHAMDKQPTANTAGNTLDRAIKERIKERIEELFLMSQGQRYISEREETDARAALLEEAEKIMCNGLFDCHICSNRFNRTNHRIILLPCRQHRVCEQCAQTLFCPDKHRPASPQPCPACRQKPSDTEAVCHILDIALNRTRRGELAVPLHRAQTLLMERQDSEDDEYDPLLQGAIEIVESEYTEGESIESSDGEDEEDEYGENDSYDSSFIDDGELKNEHERQDDATAHADHVICDLMRDYDQITDETTRNGARRTIRKRLKRYNSLPEERSRSGSRKRQREED